MEQPEIPEKCKDCDDFDGLGCEADECEFGDLVLLYQIKKVKL